VSRRTRFGPRAVLLAALWLPLWAAERRVVIIDLDGIRGDTFEQTYLDGRLPNFRRILDSALWFDNAAAVFPTVTMAGQASLFTGVPPAMHGIIGNEWFDRAAGRTVDYLTLSGVSCVYGFTLLAGSECRGGLANGHLLSPTLYEAATAAGLNSTVVFNQYWKGATHVVLPGLSDVLSFVENSSIDYEAFDRRMTDRALEALQEHGLPAILTVYFAGTDGLGHAFGIAAQPGYLERVIDYHLGRLLDALAGLDPEWRANTLFVVTADHGRTDAELHSEDLTLAADILAALKRAGFHSDRVRIAPNGGMAYVYLKGESWTQGPPEEEVRAALRELAEDPLLRRVVESARSRDEKDSPRSGDIVVMLQPNHYFGNLGVGSHHGSIHEPDLSVPLILAQGGMPAGRRAQRVQSTQIVRTVAEYLGFPVEAADPALPLGGKKGELFAPDSRCYNPYTMFQGIEHTGIASAEPERLAQWYVDHLGFRINYHSESSRGFFLRAPDGTMIEIILAEGERAPQKMKDPGLRHLAIGVGDFDIAYTALKAKGVQFLSEPSTSKGNSVVFFTDCDGNILHLIHREAPLP